jgi:hypothetical protein
LRRAAARARGRAGLFFWAYLVDIPAGVITRPDATFVGLQQFLKCIA